jgi:hypothetical protein
MVEMIGSRHPTNLPAKNIVGSRQLSVKQLALWESLIEANSRCWMLDAGCMLNPASSIQNPASELEEKRRIIRSVPKAMRPKKISPAVACGAEGSRVRGGPRLKRDQGCRDNVAVASSYRLRENLNYLSGWKPPLPAPLLGGLPWVMSATPSR